LEPADRSESACAWLGVRDPVGEETYSWGNQVERSGRAVYVFLIEAAAVILPSSAFQGEMPAVEFENAISAKLNDRHALRED
jgi:hypothetical protein